MPGLEHPASRCRLNWSSWTCATIGPGAYILGQKDASAGGEAGHQEHHRARNRGFGRVPGHGPERGDSPRSAREQRYYRSRLVVMCDLWCPASSAVPVDISTCRSRRRYAPPGGDDESEFPLRLSVLFKNLETKGSPWGQNASITNWIDELTSTSPVYGQDVDSFDGYGTCSGWVVRAPPTTKARRPPRPSPTARRRRGEILGAGGSLQRRLGAAPAARSSSSSSWHNWPSRPWTVLFGAWRPSTARSLSTCPHCFTPSARISAAGRQLPCCAPRNAQSVGARQEAGPCHSVSPGHHPCYLGRLLYRHHGS